MRIPAVALLARLYGVDYAGLLSYLAGFRGNHVVTV
jgi:hypothetical protein